MHAAPPGTRYNISILEIKVQSMPLEKRYRGRIIKRARRKADRIIVTFHAPNRGVPGPQFVVSPEEYEAARSHHFVPRTRAGD